MVTLYPKRNPLITIRKTIPEDSDVLEILFQLTRRHTFSSRPAEEFKIGDYLESTKEDEVWVAEKKGTLVGFVSIYSRDNFIHNLFVHPEYQRQGVGTRLLQIAEQHLEKPMTLKAAIDNSKVFSFYEKQGWHQASIHQDANRPYVLYRKEA